MTDRDIGKHEAQIEELQRDVAHLSDEVAALKSQVQEIHDILVQARGGWRVMVLVGGAVGAALALALKLFGMVLPLHR